MGVSEYGSEYGSRYGSIVVGDRYRRWVIG